VVVPAFRDRVKTVRRHFSRRPWQQRLVALAAAYAIALSSLIGSFGTARAAAEAVAVPGGIICHTVIAGQQAPSPGETNGKICADCCCVGCLMLLAALPPAPTKAVAAPLAASQAVAPPQRIVLVGGPQTKDHQSRAPPLAA
jgi:hypothetical protein